MKKILSRSIEFRTSYRFYRRFCSSSGPPFIRSVLRLLVFLLLFSAQNGAFVDAIKAFSKKADEVEAKLSFGKDADEHKRHCVKPAPPSSNSNFRQTGSFYSATDKRRRPLYKNLEHDSAKEPGTTAEDVTDQSTTECRKFYEKTRKFTGGVMVIWCKYDPSFFGVSFGIVRHRVAVGFHLIYKGEGRNDVFSPIYTKWKVPPRTGIYDFGCSLKGYNTVCRFVVCCSLPALG
jgi:hypothetical protein